MNIKGWRKEFPTGLNCLICQSGIAGRLPWLSDKVLLFFFLAVAFLVYSRLSAVGRFIAFIYGLVAVIALVTFMLLLVLINKAKLRKSFLGFLTIYSNFYSAEADEIQSLEKAADYIEEPFRQVIKRWVAFYRGKKELSFEEALGGILRDTGDEPEVRKFINMTKLSHRYGGDYQGLLKKMIRQEQYKEESLSKKASTAALGTGLILFMIVINLMLLLSMLNQVELAHFFHSAKGRLHLFFNALATLASFGFVLNINR